MRWHSIVRLRFEIVLVDGTRVSGSGGEMEIGTTVDANLAVLRNPANAQPYIPGSSLKGKLRSTLEKEHDKGRDGKPCSCGKRECLICVVFGAHPEPGQSKVVPSAPTRIVVRDAHFTDEYAKNYKARSLAGEPLLEEKTENLIDRRSGKAKDPRTEERVLPGAEFDGEIILHIFEKDDAKEMINLIRHAMGVVQEADAIGAGGSRGSGRVRFRMKEPETIPLKDMKV